MPSYSPHWVQEWYGERNLSLISKLQCVHGLHCNAQAFALIWEEEHTCLRESACLLFFKSAACTHAADLHKRHTSLLRFHQKSSRLEAQQVANHLEIHTAPVSLIAIQKVFPCPTLVHPANEMLEGLPNHLDASAKSHISEANLLPY